MKTLIVYAHPNPESFNHAVLETTRHELEAKGSKVEISDLYAMGFNPVLSAQDLQAVRAGRVPADVAAEQAKVKAADLVVFVFPIWWTGLPAIMKGWVDRVLSYGFAYVASAGAITPLLTGKKALMFNTTGTPQEVYDSMGMFKSLSQTSDQGIFEFCGFEVAGHHFFAGVPSADDTARKAFLSDVKRIVRGL